MATFTSAPGSDRYPSPHRGSELPFYQPAARPSIEHDDTQLRANLAAGGYDGYGANDGQLQQTPTQQAHELPPPPPHQGPVTFAPQADATEASASSSKKDRTKVSRACDECRRKKIRCDAADET
ncbi:Glucose-responsive transcription factor, partial [Teratosphaeriaceae sp. CCFEE 6253]